MRRILLLPLVLGLLAAGCGGGRAPKAQALRFEELGDTTGLTRGAPLVRTFEPYRGRGGVLHVRGSVDFPDGTRLQVSVLDRATGRMVDRFQVHVEDSRFESPPLVGPGGPFPVADYRFEVLAHFNEAWQPEEVLRRTRDGRSLRGPGITRGIHGEAVFSLVEEVRI